MLYTRIPFAAAAMKAAASQKVASEAALSSRRRAISTSASPAPVAPSVHSGSVLISRRSSCPMRSMSRIGPDPEATYARLYSTTAIEHSIRVPDAASQIAARKAGAARHTVARAKVRHPIGARLWTHSRSIRERNQGRRLVESGAPDHCGGKKNASSSGCATCGHQDQNRGGGEQRDETLRHGTFEKSAYPYRAPGVMR